jgi:Na+/melibiose symporter-like transporter
MEIGILKIGGVLLVGLLFFIIGLIIKFTFDKFSEDSKLEFNIGFCIFLGLSFFCILWNEIENYLGSDDNLMFGIGIIHLIISILIFITSNSELIINYLLSKMKSIFK